VGDQEEVVREEGRASALRDGCLCTCLLKHGQGPKSSQTYDRFPQNRANTRHRAKAISAAISRNHISWQYKAFRAVAAGCYPWQIHVF
jgi:hypothetical protein